MYNTIKSILPAISTLVIGMLFFILLGSVSALITMPPVLNMYVFSAVVILFLFVLSRSFVKFERVTLTEVNLVPDKSTVGRFIVGLLIGAVIVGIMLFTLFKWSDLSLVRETTQSLGPFVLAALIFIPMAFMEELLFRGYPFFRLSQVINIRWVVLITAILFALYHYNESQSWTVIFLGPGVWGVLYGVAAYISNSIALPLGIHASANILQALLGMKSEYLPMWKINLAETTGTTGINHESLGVAMQLVLLLLSIVVLEWVIAQRKSKA